MNATTKQSENFKDSEITKQQLIYIGLPSENSEVSLT